ncbi:MAG: hypothetical protein NXI31_04740 [bacterium]|nr:hypothetical protein [bacterium]
MNRSPVVIGRSAPSAQRNRSANGGNRPWTGRWWGSGIVGFGLTVLLTGCAGDLSERSTEELAGEIPLAEGIERVRVEVHNGTVNLHLQEDRSISYGGGVRRAADTAESLAELEKIPLELAAAPDPADPATLVVTGPRAPKGAQRSMVALQLGLKLPAAIPVEIRIERNGHVTAKERTGALTVRTGRGDLRFEGCAGSIVARTGRGNVIAFDHRGELDITTGVGDMQVFVREPGEQVRLDTGEGTVQCYVPPTAGLRLDARARIGKCGSSFGFLVEHPTQYSAVMTGARGDERTKIVLRTGKGHLSLGGKRFE